MTAEFISLIEKLTDKIIDQQNEINDLRTCLSEIVQLNTRVTHHITTLQTNIQTNNVNVAEMSNVIFSLQKKYDDICEHFPEHKTRENFKDLFNT